MGSERSFGLVFAIVFAIIAFWPLAKSGAPRWWAVASAAAFLALGYVWPAVLRPLNIAWFRLSVLLAAVVTPVVMALLYITMFLPTSLVLRLSGRDLLGLRREPDRMSYWVPRDVHGPEHESMKRQF